MSTVPFTNPTRSTLMNTGTREKRTLETFGWIPSKELAAVGSKNWKRLMRHGRLEGKTVCKCDPTRDGLKPKHKAACPDCGSTMNMSGPVTNIASREMGPLPGDVRVAA
jgi:hypothetical protein